MFSCTRKIWYKQLISLFQPQIPFVYSKNTQTNSKDYLVVLKRVLEAGFKDFWYTSTNQT